MRESVEIVNDVTNMANLTDYGPLENICKINIFRQFPFSIIREKYMFHIWPKKALI